MTDKRIRVWVQHFKDRPHLVLQWLDPDTGRRKSKGAGTADPKAAEQLRADLESDLNHGRHQEASRMTWDAFRELFEDEYLTNVREGTRGRYAYTFDLLERLINPPRLRSITERTVSTFAAALRTTRSKGSKPGLAASTIKVSLQHLHAALAWAVQLKLIATLPAFPSIKVPKKRPQPIPLESFEKLLDKAPDAAWRAYLLCGWLAGLRLSEVLQLEWEETDQAPWLDFPRDRIVLPAAFVKSVEDQWLPIDPVLKQALEDLPRLGPQVFRLMGTRGKLTPAGVSTRIINMARTAGVRLSMHSLRKGFGCRYAGKVPAQVLQRLMRHRHIATTMDYYANIDLAVEEAVLGVRCNDSRNNARKEEPQPA